MTAASPSTGSGAVPLPLRIVAADDDPVLLHSLAAIIDRHPDAELVRAVATGEDAIAVTDALHVHVALLDVEMPGLDGIETARVIRRRHPEVTVIMLTAFERPGRLDEAIAVDVHGFLTKDTPIAQILEHVRRARAGHRVLTSTAMDLLLQQRREDLAARGQYAGFVQRVRALPPRLLPVFNEMAQGKSNQRIAKAVNMQESTVRGYVSEILRALECDNRSQVVFRTGRSGLTIPVR